MLQVMSPPVKFAAKRNIFSRYPRNMFDADLPIYFIIFLYCSFGYSFQISIKRGAYLNQAVSQLWQNRSPTKCGLLECFTTHNEYKIITL